MDQVLAALLGTVVGFLLPTVASFIRSRTLGKRFVNALEQELSQAKDSIHRKMQWVSRDISGDKASLDGTLVVSCGRKLLYLGEDEVFDVSLPFWDENTRDVVETVDTESFDAICRQVVLVRRFVSKFREMKMAFSVHSGDPQAMARTCYLDLLQIHKSLLPNKAIDSDEE